MTVDFLEPVTTRSTVQDVVYRQLRAALMSGQFDPGQTLTIAMLADRFGTSHMPVREAIRRLTAENALTLASSGSASVPTVTLAGLDDLCLTRVALETLAVSLCTQRATVDDHRLFRDLLEQHERAAKLQDLQQMLAFNQRFHFAVYETCGSSVVVQFIQALWVRFGPYMRMLSAYIGPLLTSGQYVPSRHHAVMLAAIESRNAKIAEKAVKADIVTTQSLLRKLCRTEMESGKQ